MGTKVEIFTGANCAYCVAAKNLLKAKGLDYEEFRIDQDPARFQEMLQRSANRDRRSSSAQRSWIFQNVGVISSLGGILPLQEYVGMRVDQSGK